MRRKEEPWAPTPGFPFPIQPTITLILGCLDFRYHSLLHFPPLSPVLPLSGHDSRLSRRCWNGSQARLSRSSPAPEHTHCSAWQKPCFLGTAPTQHSTSLSPHSPCHSRSPSSSPGTEPISSTQGILRANLFPGPPFPTPASILGIIFPFGV